MDSEATTTIDHDIIRHWIEERDGQPAMVEETIEDGKGGILQVRFSDGSQDELQDVEWEAFFEAFERKELAFLHQQETADGAASRFYKFVDR